ncbi:hypothetical protein BG004_004466 [Podila humilis]|nr:hypothetical protein BG004_004466 [Podila humilis]
MTRNIRCSTGEAQATVSNYVSLIVLFNWLTWASCPNLSTFNKGPAVKPGDDLEMDRHLITVEEFTNSIQGNAEQILAHGAPIQARTKIIPINRVVQPQLTPISSNTSTVIQPKPYTQSDIKRKKWRAPFANTNMRQQIEQSEAVESLDDIPFDFTENDLNDIDNLSAASPSAGSIPMPTHRESPIMDRPSQPVPAPKRRKVGLSRGSVLSNSAQLSILSHRAPSTQLEFPNAARCTNFVGKNSGPKRSISLGARFSSTNQYKDGMSYLIYDNLQVMIVEIALALWAIKTTSNAKDGDAIDKFYRAKGIHMHSQAVLRKRGVDPYAGFEKYGRRGSGSSDYRLRHELMPTAGTQQAATLTLSNKEHHSK